MKKIKLIAFDLDGTLLTTDKTITQKTKDVLKAAHDKGIYLVPSTGRFFNGIPEVVRSLDCISYAITINGSYVYDIQHDECIKHADMSVETATKIMRFLDNYPVAYDCYMDNKGWMTKSLQDRSDEFASEVYARMLRSLRSPVPNLIDFINEQQKPIQKIQFFIRNLDDKLKLDAEIARKFPKVFVSSSVKYNTEINDEHANKGEALLFLSNFLGIDPDETMAFGDGGNDFTLLKAAGISVAMENGREDLKEIADIIAPSCDDDGIAKVIEELVL